VHTIHPGRLDAQNCNWNQEAMRSMSNGLAEPWANFSSTIQTQLDDICLFLNQTLSSAVPQLGQYEFEHAWLERSSWLMITG
jgi:hypothetical protein